MLVAAMNPCPCGYFKVYGRICTCAEFRVADYHARVSGPLLDRIDISLQTRPLGYRKIASLHEKELPSSHYRRRVEAARQRQRHRFRSEIGIYCNAQMTPALMRQHCAMSANAERMLEAAVKHHGLSARAHDRILKLARTRADLENHAIIEDEDMCLAIDCRMIDRKDWLARGLRSARDRYFDKLLQGPAPLAAPADREDAS